MVQTWPPPREVAEYLPTPRYYILYDEAEVPPLGTAVAHVRSSCSFVSGGKLAAEAVESSARIAAALCDPII